MANRWTWQALLERRRRHRERWRGRNWPIVTAVFATLLAGAALADEDGDKNVTAWVISVAIGFAVYAVLEWVRRHPESWVAQKTRSR